jgi:hypothetical protein
MIMNDRKIKHIWFIAILFFFQFFAVLHAEKPINSNKVEINHIQIDKQKKEIRLKASLSITQGILEYLLVSEYGKTYESIFKISENMPSELNFALMLIGCEPMPFKLVQHFKSGGDAIHQLKKKYPKSFLDIRFLVNGKSIDIFQLIENRQKTKETLYWVYTGGFFDQKNKYAGDIELSYIGIWPDKSAPVNLISKNGNPYQGQMGFEMNIKNQEINKDSVIEIVFSLGVD